MSKAFTPEQKEAYRLHKMEFAFDRAARARDIIKEQHARRYPHSRRRLPDGILSCGLPIIHDDVKVYIDERGHEYHNHITCKSWACPICAPKRANERAHDIERAMLSANSRGYTQFFMTFTVPHRKTHTSGFVIERLNACYNKFLQSRAMREIKRDHGYVGAIKCLDYTLTDNGTHAHLHVIFIFDTPLDAFDLVCAIGARMAAQWDKTVFNECGQHISHRHGFDIELIELGAPDDADASRLAHYAAKAISVYCADGDKDKGSKTPFDLLKSDASEDERKQYYDFYKGQKGRRHVFFSHGLRKALDIEEDDEKEDHPAAVVATIEYEHGYYLRDESNRAEFERRLRASISSALCWLNAETKKQQRQLARRYGDGLYRRFDIAPVALVDSAAAIDNRPGDLAEPIAAVSAAQSVFMQDYEDLQERIIMERTDKIDERHARYIARVERESAAERAAAEREGRAPRSGLGRAMHAAGYYHEPRRASLFIVSDHFAFDFFYDFRRNIIY